MFDLDGVLRNFELSWRIKFAEVFKTPIPLPSPYWHYMYDMVKSQGVDDPFEFYFMQHGEDIMADAEPYECAYDVISELQFLDHDIIIATDQPTRETRLGTLKWLNKHAIVPDELIFTSNKNHIDADWYIEDKQENLLNLMGLQLTLPWIYVVGIRRAWNSLDDIEGIIAIDNIQEYVELIKENTYDCFSLPAGSGRIKTIDSPPA
jgi:hypothetical protein